MGYILTLKIAVLSESLPSSIRYKGSHLQTAQILDSNIEKGEIISPDEAILLQIQDKQNFGLTKSTVNEFWFNCECGLEEFKPEFLKGMQYLEFEINTKLFYICLIPGVLDTYCIIRIFPFSKNCRASASGNCDYEEGNYVQSWSILFILN